MTSDPASHRRRAKGAEAAMRSPWDGDGAWRSNRGSRPQQRQHSAPPAASASVAASDRDPEERVVVAAAAAADDKCVRLLAAASAFRRGENGDARSPLAADIARLTRSKGAAFAADALATCADAAGRKATHLAARAGDVDGLDAVLRAREPFVLNEEGGLKEHVGLSSTSSSSSSSSSSVLDEGDAHGVAPLALAAWRGHVECVDYLLRRGASANRRDDFGVAALHRAVGHRQIAAATRILGDGASDPNVAVGEVSPSVPASYRATSRVGQTALHVACTRKDGAGPAGPSAGFSGDAGFGSTADARLVAALLRYGADARATDAAGDTPAHHAAAACDAAALRLLLRAGASAEAKNLRGETPADAVPSRDDGASAAGCNAGLVHDVLRGRA
jgi:ankyrin repeat protein